MKREKQREKQDDQRYWESGWGTAHLPSICYDITPLLKQENRTGSQEVWKWRICRAYNKTRGKRKSEVGTFFLCVYSPNHRKWGPHHGSPACSVSSSASGEDKEREEIPAIVSQDRRLRQWVLPDALMCRPKTLLEKHRWARVTSWEEKNQSFWQGQNTKKTAFPIGQLWVRTRVH
jgi:hypothetical protein